MTRHRHRASDEGFSVLELLVVTLVLGIILAIAFGFLAQTSEFTARSGANSEVEKEAQIALRTVTEELRGLDTATVTTCGAGFQTSLLNCMQFTVKRNASGNNPCPKSVFTVGLSTGSSPRRLLMSRADYPLAGSACAATASQTTTAKPLLSDVVNDLSASPAQNLFQFYGNDGSELSPTAAGFTFRTVDSMRVNLRLKYRNNANAIEMHSVVALRNNNTR